MPARSLPDKFLVAFSFAGEQREFVAKIAEAVEKELGRGKVFFDGWFEHYLAGHGADLKLQAIYGGRCALVVVCVSARYGGKPWTQMEHDAILARLMQSRASSDLRDRDAILPIRVGDGEVEGILFNTIVPDVRARSAAEAAELIIDRLRLILPDLATTSSTPSPWPKLSMVCCDVAEAKADILVLKYAQAFHGADAFVASKLGIGQELTLAPRTYVSFKSAGQLSAPYVIFVGVPPLVQFTYAEIRKFGRVAIEAAVDEFPAASRIALTIHGVGYGLDEQECFLAELGGILEAFESGRTGSLTDVYIVDRDPDRINRLKKLLHDTIRRGPVIKGKNVILSQRVNAGSGSEQKRHVFVAMPFSKDTKDVYRFGIQEPVNQCNVLCERVEMAFFTSDILERIKGRIASSCLVIADLTSANANVYLELGFAWGKGKPALLIAKSDEELKFDVQGHRVVKYSSIEELREQLEKDLPLLIAE
jgi:hypothetical protein